MVYVIASHYSFNTLAPGILGSKYNNLLLVAQANYQLAIRHAPVSLRHKQILPILPPGTPSDPRTLSYLIFEDQNKETKVFATVWIDEPTVVKSDTGRISILIRNVNVGELTNISDTLRSIGLNDFDINFEETL